MSSIQVHQKYIYGWTSWFYCSWTHHGESWGIFVWWCWDQRSRIFWRDLLRELLQGISLHNVRVNLLTRRTDSLEKTLMLGKIEGRRRRDDRGWYVWMASLTWWTWVWASIRRWWWTGQPGKLQSVGLQRVGHDWELNWIEGELEKCKTIGGLLSGKAGWNSQHRNSQHRLML